MPILPIPDISLAGILYRCFRSASMTNTMIFITARTAAIMALTFASGTQFSIPIKSIDYTGRKGLWSNKN